MEEYLHGTAQQAEDRQTSLIRDMESYLQVRRKTIGVLSSFNMIEMDMDIPDDIMDDPVIKEIQALGVDLTIIANVGSLPPTTTMLILTGLRTCYRTTKNRPQETINTISSPL